MHLKEYSLQAKDIKLLKLAYLACLKHLARAANWNFSKIAKGPSLNFLNCLFLIIVCYFIFRLPFL